MARRYYSSTAVATTLSSGISSGSGSITVGSTSGFPTSYPFTLILDEGTASEEVVEATNVSGTTVTVTRGVDGTSAVSHSSGANVKHGVSARDFDEPNAHVDTTTGSHGLNNALWTGTFGAWTSWTPTWSGFTLGNGTVVARYARVGKTVHWNVVVNCGSTSTATAAAATFTLPVTAARASVGTGLLSAFVAAGLVCNCSTTTCNPMLLGGTVVSALGTGGAVASGVVFSLSGTFEAA